MDDLILNVDALEEANQPFEADLPRELLDEVLRAEPATEFHAAGAAHLAGRATKLGRKVLVQAKATVPLKGQCRRCLKPVSLEEQIDLVRSYVPADQIRARVGDPEEIVAYCHSGSRSALATLALRSAGFRARNYPGSWHEWSRHDLPLEKG